MGGTEPCPEHRGGTECLVPGFTSRGHHRLRSHRTRLTLSPAAVAETGRRTLPRRAVGVATAAPRRGLSPRPPRTSRSSGTPSPTSPADPAVPAAEVPRRQPEG